MPLIKMKDGAQVSVDTIVRQATLLKSLEALNSRRGVMAGDRQFIWKMFDRWESHGHLLPKDESLAAKLLARYPK